MDKITVAQLRQLKMTDPDVAGLLTSRVADFIEQEASTLVYKEFLKQKVRELIEGIKFPRGLGWIKPFVINKAVEFVFTHGVSMLVDVLRKRPEVK